MLLQVGQRVTVKSYTALNNTQHRFHVCGMTLMGTVISGLTLLGRPSRQVAFIALDRGEQVFVDVMWNAMITRNLLTEPYEVITREEGLVHWLAGLRKRALVNRLGEFISYGANPLDSIKDWQEIEEAIAVL